VATAADDEGREWLWEFLHDQGEVRDSPLHWEGREGSWRSGHWKGLYGGGATTMRWRSGGWRMTGEGAPWFGPTGVHGGRHRGRQGVGEVA
jgi:hypothetical protein